MVAEALVLAPEVAAVFTESELRIATDRRDLACKCLDHQKGYQRRCRSTRART